MAGPTPNLDKYTAWTCEPSTGPYCNTSFEGLGGAALSPAYFQGHSSTTQIKYDFIGIQNVDCKLYSNIDIKSLSY